MRTATVFQSEPSTQAIRIPKGNIIGNMDLMIGAHALSLKAVLVTNNMREFKKIKGLKVENWVSGR